MSKMIEKSLGPKTGLIGQKIHYFKAVDSTNEIAKELSENGAVEGTVVIAETQRGGKGRLGRKWVSPVGGVWLSIVLRPHIMPVDASKITLVAALAVVKTVNQFYDLDAKIKWPNDVLIQNKKLCGILTEARADIDKVDYVIVGIGVNANNDIGSLPIGVQKSATSLQEQLGREISIEEFVLRLLKEFEGVYKKFTRMEFSSILNDWKKFSDTLGNLVRVHIGDEIIDGRAVDLDQNGALVIRKEDGSLKTIIAGDCTYLKNI